MKQIDEWNPVYSKQVGSSGAAPGAASQTASNAADLVGRISGRLQALDPRPDAVHFYRGEGLRWIRVGFDNRLLEPGDVEVVGEAIQAGIGDPGKTLYFQALRPYDLLFFMEHFDPESTGMPPDDFGAPLHDVLAAWWPKPSRAAKKRA